jgi:predicted Zn-ribbon and HTH transcriptional regulator
MGVQLDKTIDELEILLRTKLRGEILDYLTTHRCPHGSRDIAAALGKPRHAVQRAVCDLVLQGRITQVARGADRKPVYRPVEVGPCEWCGLISHRLVAGECPACKTLTIGLARPSLARLVC